MRSSASARAASARGVGRTTSPPAASPRVRRPARTNASSSGAARGAGAVGEQQARGDLGELAARCRTSAAARARRAPRRPNQRSGLPRRACRPAASAPAPTGRAGCSVTMHSMSGSGLRAPRRSPARRCGGRRRTRRVGGASVGRRRRDAIRVLDVERRLVAGVVVGIAAGTRRVLGQRRRASAAVAQRRLDAARRGARRRRASARRVARRGTPPRCAAGRGAPAASCR